MKAVVTGATGCLGMNLCKRLISEGYQVTAIGRNEVLGAILSQSGVHFKKMDLSNQMGLKTICETKDVVFHCAALSSPWGKFDAFYQSNVLVTKHVIAATPIHARLVYVSTPSLYFDFTEKHHISEKSPLPLKAANHYVATKRMAEELIDNAHHREGLKVITLRPRAILGSYDRAIMPRLLKTEKNGVLPIIGSGQNRMDMTCVDNVVESLLLAANANENVLGNKYNITNDDPRPLIEILTLLYAALNRPLKTRNIPYSLARMLAKVLELSYHGLNLSGEPRLTSYTASVLALGQTLNIEAAKKDLGYKPIVSLEEGIKRFVNWYSYEPNLHAL
ncbi:NAD-dependent epimerase/dehydratase family protein [Legionella impletisoli]|uniref:3-beta hydroxysteroid dehydrogenase n=1 Tax=Legionella impletisoli TaxID=343510 RepID=A0A917JSZ4_9GAMM|nr:NAD-dependent epimerase/dehydratase family protein [Legionella impletisoli]GGI82323.1 3-beta hydroxysteroid dehydrogenase [Legionella impletisoli]